MLTHNRIREKLESLDEILYGRRIRDDLSVSIYSAKAVLRWVLGEEEELFLPCYNYVRPQASKIMEEISKHRFLKKHKHYDNNLEGRVWGEYDYYQNEVS